MYLKTWWYLTSVVFSPDRRNLRFLISHYFSPVPHQLVQICPDAPYPEQVEQGATQAVRWLESCFRYLPLSCILSPVWTLTYGQKLGLVIFSYIFIFLKGSMPWNKTRSPWILAKPPLPLFFKRGRLFWKGHQIDSQISSFSQTKKREHLILELNG